MKFGHEEVKRSDNFLPSFENRITIKRIRSLSCVSTELPLLPNVVQRQEAKTHYLKMRLFVQQKGYVNLPITAEIADLTATLFKFQAFLYVTF